MFWWSAFSKSVAAAKASTVYPAASDRNRRDQNPVVIIELSRHLMPRRAAHRHVSANVRRMRSNATSKVLLPLAFHTAHG